MVEKMSISLPLESLAQLEWLAKYVFFCPDGAVSRSTLIRLAILYAYEKAPRKSYDIDLESGIFED